MSNAVSITLGVGGAPYQKTLTAALINAGMLRRALNMGPLLEIQDLALDGSLQVIKQFPIHKLVRRLVWGIWSRLPGKIRPGYPGMIEARLADELWSRWIPPCDVFHGWTGFSLACLRSAKRVGARALLENAGSHPRHWHASGLEECVRFGIDPKERFVAMTARNVDHVEREFELCERILVPSRYSFGTFAERGLADKAQIVPTGVDTQFFSPPASEKVRPLFRVCFVGRVELAKGIGYLLQAWKRLALPDAELVLAGGVKREMDSVFLNYADSSVRTTGIVSSATVAETYRDSDLFVIPSVNEGLAQVLLEAMASGLPIVASDHSGADDVITDGKEGFIVPVRDVDRLAEAILWGYQHRDELRGMGRAARARIESNFTLEHYNQRMIEVYREVAASGREGR
jgi:alpha-maltose-1-phosphate synthase